MEEFALLKDFAIIMVVAGAVTLLFRGLRQPPILGYLLAGLLIGPYTLPTPPVTDVHTIRLLADLGLVLLLFGLGLGFSWSKIRQVGLSVLIIGVLEILTMISIGYGLGKLLGWSTMDALFLGAAMHISSSALIVKILRDMGKLDLLSSRLIVGILVVEDFAAVAIIAVLSGVATVGTASFGDIGSLALRLIIFVVASLAFGAIIVPRIIRFTARFHSKEALLITSLGLCFAMALLGNYLGLSAAAGAFLMGALIGDTEHSEEIAEVVTPVRDMFAALFFVTIGMLINIAQFSDFIVPTIIVAAVFMVGKILSNTLATFVSGHDGKTSLQVGMGMPQMGEFSLAIAKLGIDRGVVVAPLYPLIASVTALTSLTGPYIMRSGDSVANFLNRRLPALLKAYVSRLADWVQALRAVFARDSKAARKVQRSGRTILINLLIVMVIIGVGTFALQYVKELALLTQIRADLIGLALGFLFLMGCMPSFVAIWRSVRALGDEAATYVLSRRPSAKEWRRKAVRIVLRDSIVILLSILVGVWFIPFISSLLLIGSLALAVPLLLLALIIYLVSRSVIDIHTQLERTFSRTLLGDEYITTSEAATLLGTSQSMVEMLARQTRLHAVKIGRRWQLEKAEVEELAKTFHAHEREFAEEAGSEVEGSTDESKLKGDKKNGYQKHDNE
jgi:CPA2 family monovalent cation:H+ antiporter-2